MEGKKETGCISWKDVNVALKIVNVILFFFGFGWFLTGAVILGGVLLDSDVNQILNFISILSTGLGDEIKILSSMLIVIGLFVMLEAIIGFFLKTMLSKKQKESRWNVVIYLYFIFGLLLLLSTLIIFGLWINTRVKLKDDGPKIQLVKKLHEEYKDDALSSTETVSKSLNMAFMELDCCAVNPVVGTTNDFDLTPWCTTSGECQQTNSQIPKTCCNGVTVSTYSSAPSACHANVDSGTYNNQGCYDVLVTIITSFSSGVIAVGVPLIITEIVVAILALYISKSFPGN